jgi:hypothetical protein
MAETDAWAVCSGFEGIGYRKEESLAGRDCNGAHHGPTGVAGQEPDRPARLIFIAPNWPFGSRKGFTEAGVSRILPLF